MFRTFGLKFTHDIYFSLFLLALPLRAASCTVNYVWLASTRVAPPPSDRIKIRDKPTINKARTHNSFGIKTHLAVYRKLNLSLRRRGGWESQRSSRLRNLKARVMSLRSTIGTNARHALLSLHEDSSGIDIAVNPEGTF